MLLLFKVPTKSSNVHYYVVFDKDPVSCNVPQEKDFTCKPKVLLFFVFLCERYLVSLCCTFLKNEGVHLKRKMDQSVKVSITMENGKFHFKNEFQAPTV